MDPPELHSFIPPVNGLLPPTEIRPEFGADVPLNIPGANISLLFLPRGWQVALTSSLIKFEVRARPPRPIYFSGTSPTVACRVVISIRINLFINPPN